MPMDCLDVQTRLPVWLDHELDADARVLVATHLETCPMCRAHAESLRSLDANLRHAFRPQREAAVQVADRVIDALNLSNNNFVGRALLPVEHQATGKSAPPTSQRSSWIWLLLAAAAGFVVALLIFPPGRREVAVKDQPPSSPRVPEPEPSVARLVVATGDVEVRAPGGADWQSVATPEQFRCSAGTEVRTGTGVRCELETADGCAIRLNELAELAVRSQREVELRAGQIWCSSPPAASLRVVTPAKLNAALPNESPWSFACPSNAACLTEVREGGELRVISANGDIDIATPSERQRLRQGEVAKIVDGRLVIETHRADALLATSWMHSLLTRKGHSSEELTQRVDRLLANVGRSKIAALYEDEIRSLGEYCVLPLLRFVQSPLSRDDAGQRLTAMRILADVAPSWAIAELIDLLADDEPQVRVLAATALLRLTRQTHGRSPAEWSVSRSDCEATHAAWKRWWQQHQQRYPLPFAAPRLKKA